MNESKEYLTTEQRQAWRLRRTVGRFQVWYAGKDSYRVVRAITGEIVGYRGDVIAAHSYAKHLSDVERYGIPA